METHVNLWWQWYTATHPWYSSSIVANGRTHKIERITVKPARMVCQEWASLIFGERTIIATEDEKVNTFLDEYLESTLFLAKGQGLIERAMALGTGAWALRVEDLTDVGASDGARIVAQRFDARYVVPLSYDEDTCTECAFVSSVVVSGKRYEQIQMHQVSEDTGDYTIETVFLNDKGERVVLPGYLDEPFDTKTPTPKFALVRPGLENSKVDFSPFGVSVFDDAIGAVQLTDEAFDSLHNDLYLGRKMLFLDPEMLEQDNAGNVIIPREADQQLFRKLERSTGDTGKAVEEYNPDLRVEQNRAALNTALEMLGTRTGFGAAYFSLEGDTGLKTATEVVAENSDLYRNVRKHENALTPAVQTIVAGIIDLARVVKGEGLPEDYGQITVTYDDSVMEDTEAQRTRDLREVSSGLMQPWEFRVKWYGEDEKTARQMVEGTELPEDE
jgi:A118 family predicted phage portal protein